MDRGILGWYARVVTRLTLFQKLAILTLLVAILPIIWVSPLFFRQANEIILQETQRSNERALSQLAQRINNDLTINQKALSTFATMQEVMSILSSDPSQKSAYEQFLDRRKIEESMLTVNMTDSVFRLRLYLSSEFDCSRERVNTFPMSDIESEPWFSHIGRLPYVYIPPREERYIYQVKAYVASIATGIQQYKRKNDVIGVAMADLDLAQLEKMLSALIEDASGAVFIIGADGVPIISAGGEDAMRLFSADLPFAQEDESSASHPGWHLQWMKLDFPGWTLVEAIPAAKMGEGGRMLLFKMLIILLVTIPLTVLLATMTSRSFTGKITKIAHAVKRFTAGDANVRLTITSGDELGAFEQDVNRMFERTNQLMQERYELGQQAKSADINALQAQINPHFLYNTLDLLYWMAKDDDTENLSHVIVSLSQFYRKTLSKGREVILLRDEIELTKLYLDIQNQRFSGAISTLWDVDESLLDEPILKLLLQPIVENAVLHGINQSPDRHGTIRVSVQHEGGFLQIQIADDGAGMTKEQADSLMAGGSGASYGIHNVQKRIRIFYGEQYGLDYKSAPGGGTLVTLRVPKRS